MYATSADLIARYGQTEIIRLTTPDGEDPVAVDEGRANTALTSASARVDGYLRARYAVPVAASPIEIKDAVCSIARFHLAHGEQREPTEQMRKAYEDAIGWLKLVAMGTVLLDLPQPSSSPTSGDASGMQSASGARVQDRPRDTPSMYKGYI
jgi:phage gp36-like protein